MPFTFMNLNFEVVVSYLFTLANRQGCSGVGTRGNSVPTPFCTGNVT